MALKLGLHHSWPQEQEENNGYNFLKCVLFLFCSSYILLILAQSSLGNQIYTPMRKPQSYTLQGVDCMNMRSRSSCPSHTQSTLNSERFITLLLHQNTLNSEGVITLLLHQNTAELRKSHHFIIIPKHTELKRRHHFIITPKHTELSEPIGQKARIRSL